MEFITLPTPSDHAVPIEELRKVVLRNNQDLKDKSAFWNRKASCLKVGGLGLRRGWSWALVQFEGRSGPVARQARRAAAASPSHPLTRHPQAELLFRAHLEREGDDIPAKLRPDLKYVLGKAPVLLEQVIGVRGRGWCGRSCGVAAGVGVVSLVCLLPARGAGALCRTAAQGRARVFRACGLRAAAARAPPLC
jgi:hypothetical protein